MVVFVVTGRASGSDGRDRLVENPRPADGPVMEFARSIHMDRKGQVSRRREFVKRFFELDRVGAEIDEAFEIDQTGHDVINLWMQQRFAAGNRNDRRPALLGCVQTLIDRQVTLQNRGWMLDLATTGAGQVASHQRFQHQHQRIARVAEQTLFPNMAENCDCLPNRYAHDCFPVSHRDSVVVCSANRGQPASAIVADSSTNRR